MKILMTTDTVGGVWEYTAELARALARHDVEVVLAAMGGSPRDDQRAAIECLPSVTLHESDYRLEWMPEPWDDLDAAAEWLLDLQATERPDLVHLNQYAHGHLPWRVPVVVAGHSCVWSWWSAVRRGPAPPDWRRYRTAVARGLRHAGAIVAPSEPMLKSLQNLYRPDAGRCLMRVIHNGRCPEDYPPRRKEPLVFASGRLWDEAKNLSTLGEAALQIPWPVFVAGPVDAPAAAARGAEVPPGLQYLGTLGRGAMAECLGCASIYAHPARYEPFGLGVLEAGLAGCALVLGDIPSLRTLWRDAAMFVEPDDVSGLTDALCGLAADPDRRRELGTRARRRALTYSSQRMGTNYLALYRTLTATAAASRAGGRAAGALRS